DWHASFSAVSARVAREAQPMAGERPMSILSNGIDAAFWQTDRSARADGPFQLISVMRLNPKKRPLALVDTMRRLRTLLPNREFRVRIVGEGPVRARLERAVAMHGFAGRVEVLGRRSREEIRALHATSDAFVLPTVRESFGLAALEARCAGLPVVAMRASGV